jgi:hypothetical protein
MRALEIFDTDEQGKLAGSLERSSGWRTLRPRG